MSPKQTWQVLLDDENWADDVQLDLALQRLPKPDSSVGRKGFGCLTVLLLIGLIVGIGGLYLWQEAQAGLGQAEADLTGALAVEELARQSGDEDLANALVDGSADESWQTRLGAEIQNEAQREGATTAIQTEISWLDLRGDLALVQLRLDDPAQPFPYRVSRFYRQTETGWLRTEPTPVFWGSAQSLESEFFQFQFHHKDLTAVAEAAPRLDALYGQMHTRLGLSANAALPPGGKFRVEVVVNEQSAKRLYMAPRGDLLQISAPALLPIPLHLSDADALVDAVTLALRRTVTVAALDQNTDRHQTPVEMLVGLRLWLAWESGHWTTEGRINEVGWLYSNLPLGPQNLPPNWDEGCQMAWMLRLAVVDDFGYPSNCTYQALPLPFLQPATRLGHLPLTLDLEEENNGGSADAAGYPLSSLQGLALSYATLFAYTSATYGPQAVPALLEVARTHGNWQDVPFAAFGVSPAAFEAGWWNWLAQAYQVDTTEFAR